MRAWRRRAWLLAALALAGCQSLPEGRSDLISGRLAMHVDASGAAPERSLSALFELKGDGERGQLQLTTPLGTAVAQAHWQPRQVTLTTSQGSRDFSSLAELATETMGEAVPLQALFDWLRGRPWPASPAQPLVGAEGFEQLGWRVDLARFGEGWVQIRREAAPRVSLRVILDSAS